MQVKFTKWSMDPASRTSISVNPDRVDCVELYMAAAPVRAAIWTGEAQRPFDEMMEAPAASRIHMMGKQEFLVEGSVEEVNRLLKYGNPHSGLPGSLGD